jgi:hypothetical protein
VLTFLLRPIELAKATHRDTVTNLAIDICSSLRIPARCSHPSDRTRDRRSPRRDHDCV